MDSQTVFGCDNAVHAYFNLYAAYMVCKWMCVFVFVCVCVCVCDSGRRTSATWSWRLASRRGPQPDRMCSLLAARVVTWTADVIWGSLAESVCGRVGLIVAPESGAYTVACIDLLTFQEELH